VELPIFPLGTVLLPGGLLPLKIFEQRYLEMTKACLRDGSEFGVCLIRQGREVGAPAVPAEVGCTARIRDWDMPHAGIFVLLAEGGTRFRLGARRVNARGLIIGEIEPLPQLDAAARPPEYERCAAALRALAERGGAGRLPEPLRYDDAAWLGYRLAERLPLAPAARQKLLETDSADLLLGLIGRLLGDARPR
jgi:Lon protease-like protein